MYLKSKIVVFVSVQNYACDLGDIKASSLEQLILQFFSAVRRFMFRTCVHALFYSRGELGWVAHCCVPHGVCSHSLRLFVCGRLTVELEQNTSELHVINFNWPSNESTSLSATLMHSNRRRRHRTGQKLRDITDSSQRPPRSFPSCSSWANILVSAPLVHQWTKVYASLISPSHHKSHQFIASFGALVFLLELFSFMQSLVCQRV